LRAATNWPRIQPPWLNMRSCGTMRHFISHTLRAAQPTPITTGLVWQTPGFMQDGPSQPMFWRLRHRIEAAQRHTTNKLWICSILYYRVHQWGHTLPKLMPSFGSWRSSTASLTSYFPAPGGRYLVFETAFS
jgi:hypothetical protein